MLDDNRYLELIGLKVKLLRKRKRMSQQELAEKVGYDSGKSMISLVESGKINITMDKLVKISKALDVPMYELMREDLSILESDRPAKTAAFSSDPLAGLDQDDIKKVVEYIKLLKGAKEWQQLNGTDKDGGSGSQLMGGLDLSQIQPLDAEDAKLLSDVQESAAASMTSPISKQHGLDTSTK